MVVNLGPSLVNQTVVSLVLQMVANLALSLVNLTAANLEHQMVMQLRYGWHQFPNGTKLGAHDMDGTSDGTELGASDGTELGASDGTELGESHTFRNRW